VLISILTTGKVAMWSIILVGLFNSVMFPSIFTLAIEGLGRLTGRGSSLLVMAIVGGAVIPEVQAILADRLVGLHAAFLVPAICYLYIVFYGLSLVHVLNIRFKDQQIWRAFAVDLQTRFVVPLDDALNGFAVLHDDHHGRLRLHLLHIVKILGVGLIGRRRFLLRDSGCVSPARIHLVLQFV